MFRTLFPATALFAGVALLLLGSGLLNSLLALRGSALGFGDATLGLISSGYFVGFLIGTFLAPTLIRRIGHVRTFAFCAAAAACTALAHALLDTAWTWLVLRVVAGMALVNLYVAIESWLNAIAPDDRRAQLFAVYMTVNLGALALAQHLLRIADPVVATLPILVALLICAAVMPVTWTRLSAPELPPTPRLRLLDLYRRAPSALAGALLSGLAMGPFWGLAPLQASRSGLDTSQVAWVMSAAIVGGALLQWPVGRWSDRSDRRIALALASTAAVIAGVLLAFSIQAGWIAQAAMMFAYGGLAFAIYPLAVAHLVDHLQKDELLAAISTALLLHGVGAAIGPLLAGAAMQRYGDMALPLYFAATHGVLALAVAARLTLRARVPRFTLRFRPMLRTTPVALELLPTEDTPAAGNGQDS
jgi:MFS family permease